MYQCRYYFIDMTVSITFRHKLMDSNQNDDDGDTYNVLVHFQFSINLLTAVLLAACKHYAKCYIPNN